MDSAKTYSPLFSDQQRHTARPHSPDRKPSSRARLFGAVLLLGLTLGGIWTMTIDPVYQSRASLLITPPAAVDEASDEADLQRVAIQREVMLSAPVLSRALEKLGQEARQRPDLTTTRDLLRTEPVDGTNLVSAIAEGADRDLLTPLVNSWVTAYVHHRNAQVTEEVATTTESLRDELKQVSAHVAQARDALHRYRRQHDIVSTEREENEALSRIRGANDSLNLAREAELKAKARLDELTEKAARGEKMVPDSQAEYVMQQENLLNALQAKLTVLERKYTREYINMKGDLREIPLEIDSIKEELQSLYASGAQLALEEARQAYDSARLVVENLQAELIDSKSDARDITAVFAEHEALATDLAELEELHRTTLTRLAQLESRQLQNHPQISVIAAASPARRIAPDYGLLALCVLGAALATALFVTWLSSWLHGRHETSPTTLNGIHIYAHSPNEVLGYQQTIRESLGYDSELENGTLKLGKTSDT